MHTKEIVKGVSQDGSLPGRTPLTLKSVHSLPNARPSPSYETDVCTSCFIIFFLSGVFVPGSSKTSFGK